MKPIRYSVNPGIRLAVVGDGYIAYDTDRDTVHHLNPTAAPIFEFCDGRRGPEEIAAILARTFDGPGGGVDEIGAWLSEAADRGLLTTNPILPAEATEIDGETLARLATRLRDEGEIRKAFLCQQRAAELAGEEPEIWRSLGELAHILVALRDEPPPSRAPDESVLRLYERFSEFYDESMRDELEYRAPEMLLEALDRVMPIEPAGLDVLDLGCGTGLAGPLVRRCYDRLEISELGDWLTRAKQRYDLVLACDVFVYFGDLTAVFESVERIMVPDGLFGFTVEKGVSEGVALTDSGRYAHGKRHIEAAADGAGLAAAPRRGLPVDRTDQPFSLEHVRTSASNSLWAGTGEGGRKRG